MWDLPGPGIESVSPALAGGLLTTVPPGKPSINSFNYPLLPLPSFMDDSSQIVFSIKFIFEGKSYLLPKCTFILPCCLEYANQ